MKKFAIREIPKDKMIAKLKEVYKYQHGCKSAIKPYLNLSNGLLGGVHMYSHFGRNELISWSYTTRPRIRCAFTAMKFHFGVSVMFFININCLSDYLEF